VVPFLIYKSPGDAVATGNLLSEIFGITLMLSGMILFLYTVILFNNVGKGTLAPWSPKQKLVVSGPYRYCRNPMITGVFFILLGETLFFRSTPILIWSGVFFIINTLYFIISEEPKLLAKFGDEYRAYSVNVPRWIPRLRPYQKIPH
jgi:protein-S-isoprenylcysteine O-methyltransferase Ste14